jgi:integrase
MTTMRQAAHAYLALRRSLGHELTKEGRLLLDFADHLDRQGAGHVTIDLAVAWATAPADATAYWHCRRLGMIRGFASYLHAIEPGHQILPGDLVPPHYVRPTPYLFSTTEITALMQAAGRMRQALPALTYHTLIGLLAVTGLRPGEAYRLDRHHVDLDQALLTVEHGKYGKSRQLILHPSTGAALDSYSRQRDRLHPHPTEPSFFVTMRGTRMSTIHAEAVFVRLAHSVGIQPRSARTRPRLKDLRHTFAINTLIGWYHDDLDIDARLPILSTWLGHIDPKSTYWYLSASPQLLALAADRMSHPHQPPGERS